MLFGVCMMCEWSAVFWGKNDLCKKYNIWTRKVHFSKCLSNSLKFENKGPGRLTIITCETQVGVGPAQNHIWLVKTLERVQPTDLFKKQCHALFRWFLPWLSLTHVDPPSSCLHVRLFKSSLKLIKSQQEPSLNFAEEDSLKVLCFQQITKTQRNNV